MNGPWDPWRGTGFDVELRITATGERAVAIAREGGPGGGRCLVARVPWAAGHDDPDLRETRVPWDLPLVALRAAGPDTMLIVEALPIGEPSTTFAPADVAADASAVGAADAPTRLQPFAAELACRVATAHARGEIAGPLHPALVFVAPDGSLAGIAQRVLRVRLPATHEGLTPLFGAIYPTPADIRGEAAGPAEDVFRLAAMAWRWRHRAAPFGVGMAELSGVLAGRPATEPRDDVDRLLARAFAPAPGDRPSAADLAEALDTAVGPDGR